MVVDGLVAVVVAGAIVADVEGLIGSELVVEEVVVEGAGQDVVGLIVVLVLVTTRVVVDATEPPSPQDASRVAVMTIKRTRDLDPAMFRLSCRHALPDRAQWPEDTGIFGVVSRRRRQLSTGI